MSGCLWRVNLPRPEDGNKKTMTKEYMLVATKIDQDTGTRVNLVIIDRLSARGIREAEAKFRKSHDFPKILSKHYLTIVKSEKFFE